MPGPTKTCGRNSSYHPAKVAFLAKYDSMFAIASAKLKSAKFYDVLIKDFTDEFGFEDEPLSIPANYTARPDYVVVEKFDAFVAQIRPPVAEEPLSDETIKKCAKYVKDLRPVRVQGRSSFDLIN